MPRDAYRIGDSRNFKEEEEEKGLVSEFTSGFSSGVDTTLGTLGGVRSLFNTVTGDEEEAIEYLNYARQKFQDASESSGTVESIEEIDGADDFVRWALYSAGTIVPSIATSVLGGGVGGFAAKKGAEKFVKDKVKKEVYDRVQDDVSEAAKKRMYRETLAGKVQPYRGFGQGAGAFTASAAQNTGSTYLDIYEETGIEAPDVALAAGVASGALDAITPFVILRRIMPPTVFTKFKDKLSDRVVENGGVVRRSMLEATKQAGFEGFTEASQELIQATAVGMMRNDPAGEFGFGDYADAFVQQLGEVSTDDQLRSRLLNAAAVGAIGGTFTGGVSGVFKGEKSRVKDATKGEEPKVEAKQASEEQQSQKSEEEQIQAIIAEFGGIDRKEARRILVQRQTNQETASLELGEERQAPEQQAPFSSLDDAPEQENLELDAIRQRQRIVRERAQGLGGESRRRGVAVDEQRARVYEDQLNESMGRVLRGRRVLNEIIPVSLYEGTTTPEENAQAAQEAERITVLPSGPTIELGPNRTMEELAGVARVDSEGNTSISGQTVDYQGIKGTLTRREDGVFVVVTPEGDEVVVESGESDAGSTAAALLGVTPVDINVDTPAPDIQFNSEDQTFISRGKKYRYNETRYGDDGQPVAIDAETMDGQPRVFRSQRTLRAMEAEQAKIQQSEMTQNLASGPAQFDDLSETLQMAVFDQRETQGVDTATDSVTREEIEAAVESAPASIQASLRRETETLFARDTETEFDIRTTFKDEDQWLSFEGDVVNANQETLESRQERLDLLSGQPNKPANSDDLITIKGVEGVAEKVGNAMRRKAFFKLEVDGQETNLEVMPAENIAEINGEVDPNSATNEIQQAVFDLIEAGLPTEFVDDIQAIAVHLAKDMDALGATSNDRMSLDSAMVSKSLVDPDSDRELRYVLAHEAWHVIDNKVDVSGTLPSFNVEITFGAEGPKIVLGDALADLYDNYLQGTELGRRFTYPFNEIEQRLGAETSPAELENIVKSLKGFIKKESFAQLGAVYVSNPRLLKQQAPEAYNVIRTIRDNPKLVTGDEDARVQNTEVGVQPEGAGVQGEVRPSPVSGSNEVEADGGAREAGLDGAEAGQADQDVGGETQQEAGDSDGPDVQQGLTDSVPEQGTLFVRRLEKSPTKQEQSRRDLLKKIATVAVVSGSGVKGTAYYAEIASNPELVRGKAKPISDFIQRSLPEESVSALAFGDLPRSIDLAVAGAPQDVIDLANKIKATLPEQDLYDTDVQRGQWNVAGMVSMKNRPTITIMPDTKDSGMTGTLLHEAMHLGIAARYRSLSTVSSGNYELVGMDQPKAREALDQWNSLWREFRRAVNPNLQRSKVDDLPFETQVAYGSPDEFFVRALTQPEFQQQLYEIDYEGKTLLERFKDWVKRYLFGPDTGVQPTYLDAAMTAANDLFDAATLDSPDFAFMRGVNANLAQERDDTQNELIDVPSQKRGQTGRPYQGLPANETLGGEDRVQTSLPNGTRLGEKYYVIGKPEDNSIGIDRILTDQSKPPLKEKLQNTIKGYDFFTPSRPDLSPEETIEEFKEHMVSNLLWLHDQMDPDVREEAKQWYDGARRQVDIWVDRYGLEPRQVAAVVANLSPQKDWFMNMSLAERMLDIFSYRQDFVADEDMNKAFTRIVLTGAKGKPIQVSKLDKKAKAAFTLQRDIWRKIKNQPLSGIEQALSPEEVNLGQAIWIRMYDEAKHSRKFRVMSPSGEIMGLSMGKEGPQSVAWGSFTEIMKGVKVLRDGSLESVSLSLGDAHKVRNFYNNIVAPNSELGEVTIDTHAVAAALFKPLSAKGYEVSHAFGGTPKAGIAGIPDGVVRAGAGSSSKIGAGGTYGIIADAYREAAERLGILPRQLQSITWEEIRVVYPASFKDEKGKNLGKINDLWTRYANDDLSIDEVREQAYGLTGTEGNKPVWAGRSNVGVNEEQRNGTYSRDVYSTGVSRPRDRGRDVGSGSDVDATAGATDGGLAATVKVGKPNTKVRPSVQRAYEALQDGQITRQEYDEAVLETIRPYEAVPTPATAEEMSSALRGTQVDRVNQPVDDGASVGLRLDINAYEKKDTWVPTIHDAKGRPISHMATAAVTGADFTDFKQGKAQKVMEGGTKTPFAQIKGAYVGRSDEENVRLAQQYLNDPEWRQVGFDPRRHSTFYDRATGESIATADEVIQVGPLVLAKNAVPLPTEQTLFVKRLSGETQTYEEANAARNAVIREEKKAVDQASSWLTKTFKRQLTSRGLLNEQVFQAKIARDGEFGAAEIDTRMYLNSYDKAVKDADLTEEQTALLSEAISTPLDQLNSLDLPDAVKQAIGGMRKYLDKMSIDYAAVVADQALQLAQSGKGEAAAAKVDLLNTIASNKGKYLNRSYQVFDDPNWANKVSNEVINDARELLESNGAQNADRIINTILKEGTAFDGLSNFISEGNLGSKDLSILKKRKDIAPEILALMGEYTDPRINFVKTATKVSRLLWNHRFLERVKLEGQRDGFLFTAEDAPTDAYVQIAPDSSDAMNPLNGLYTTPELAQGFKDAMDLGSNEAWVQTWQQINSVVKYGKTVIAPTTIARNFMSASFFTIANGHFNWAKADASLKSLDGYFSSKEGDATAYLREIRRLGVVYDSPYAGELTKALEDFSKGTELDNKVRAIDGLTDTAIQKSKSFLDLMAKNYQYGDDFWKIIGFENMVDVLMENKGISREEAMPLAAERIRDTYPTYSLIGKGIKDLRRFPLVGTFVSFPAEIVRTSFNMFKYLKQDMADPDMSGHAMAKVAGMSAVSFGIYALQEAALSAFDVDEEEQEAIRLMSPTWSENSNILPTGRDENGNLEYIDLTYLDPYAYFKKPINALMRDQPTEDAIVQAGRELLTPFFGVDIATNTALEIYNNERVSGGRIWNPSDTPANKLSAATEHLIKGAGPAVIQNVTRTAKAINGAVSKSGKRYELEDELRAWVGFRVTTFDPKISLHFKAYEFNQDKRNATSLLTSTFRDPNELDAGELENAFDRASSARREGYERMIKLVSSAKKAGLSNTQLMVVLRSNGVTLKDAKALIAGNPATWGMSDSTLKNSIKKSDLLFGKSTSREFERRWRVIQRLLREESQNDKLNKRSREATK